MFFKYCSLIILFNKHIAHGIEYFDITNDFKHLNERLNPEERLVPSDINTRWIEQELDHFDPKETRTWKMKYYERLNFWKTNGPIYLLLGGEGPVSHLWTTTGVMYELAKETNGIMYVSEHRYYGDSKPLNITDVKYDEHFRFLSSRQALADNAKLLKSIKLRPKFRNSKVVVVGCSYAGNLAAWMRLLYPEIIDAAIASSGPVLAKKNFYEYFEKINENYDRYGTAGCLNKTRNIFERYDRLIKSSEGIKQLKEEENICKECDLTVIENQHLFFMFKIAEFMSISQYGNTTAIKNHCNNLDNSLQSRVFNKESKADFRLERERCTCYNFSVMIQEYKAAENNQFLAWTYQTCTEFGYYQTSSSKSQPFKDNIDLNFYIKTCSTLFGAAFDEKRVDTGVNETNTFYGGLTPYVTKVVFTNGDLDPWSALSVLEDLPYNAPAVLIPRSSHCLDLFSNREDDMEELKAARKYVKNVIKSWIL